MSPLVPAKKLLVAACTDWMVIFMSMPTAESCALTISADCGCVGLLQVMPSKAKPLGLPAFFKYSRALAGSNFGRGTVLSYAQVPVGHMPPSARIDLPK